MARRRFRPLETLKRRQRRKALALALLKVLMRWQRTREPPNWRSRPHRILYLRYDRIGDLVLATGIIRAIVLAQPTVTVDVLASVGNAAVLEGNPHVGEVVRIDKSRPWSYLAALRRIRRARYDAVVDTMVMAPSFTALLLMWASGAAHRIGIGDGANDFALTLPVARRRAVTHYIDHSAALLSAFGVDPEQGLWRPQIFLSAQELREAAGQWDFAERGTVVCDPRVRRRRLIVNVSAGGGWRCWAEEHYIETLRWIGERFPGLSILIIGAPDDTPRMTRIAHAADVPLAPTARYRQMMALVATSDVVLTPDTSVTHVASAFGKTIVGLFAGDSAELYGPYATPGRSLSSGAPTLDPLGVSPVVDALEAVLIEERDSRTEPAGRVRMI